MHPQYGAVTTNPGKIDMRSFVDDTRGKERNIIQSNRTLSRILARGLQRLKCKISDKV